MLRVNSKKVENGDTFLALKGTYHDGHDYIEEAIDKGAACIIAEHGDYKVKTIIVKDTRTYLSNYLKDLYLERLEKIKIIGISGSSGKTITGDILCQLLNKLDYKTACISTNGFYLNDKVEKLPEATPDIYQIYELIDKAISNDCKAIIIEASSKAVYKRHLEGLEFDIAIYTNFIPTIRDEEKVKQYLDSKLEIFRMLKKNGYAIINGQDKFYQFFTLPNNHNIVYGTNDSAYQINNINLTYDYSEFDIDDAHIKLPLLGKYNVNHYLASYITAHKLDFTLDQIIDATANLTATDGRYQNIKYKDNLIIIDYAHSLNSIDDIIKETKEFSQGKIITIVGCGGDRDKTKRPKIGKLVTEKCDYVIFTNDNPRTEDPKAILNDITSSLNENNYIVIENRKEAIKKGIEMLKEKDILLVLGKGHEDKMIIDNDNINFKDYDEIMKIIK